MGNEANRKKAVLTLLMNFFVFLSSLFSFTCWFTLLWFCLCVLTSKENYFEKSLDKMNES
jgi:hypothetical protein